MSKVLFNFDDLALISVISSSLIFIKLLLYNREEQSHKAWLAIFLGCIVLASLNSILYWSPIIRLELTGSQPHLFLLLQSALLAAPPALYIYTRSLIHNNFSFTRADLLYFSPTLLYLLCVPAIYYTMDASQMAESALDYEALYSNPIFWFFAWFQHLIKISYGVATLQLLRWHQEALQQTNSNTHEIDGNWLKLMVVGFLSLWILQAVSQLCHQIHWTGTAQFVALFGNYYLFGLVNLLVVLSLTRSTARSTARDHLPEEPVHQREYTDEQIQRLARTMAERQPYLKPDLTLEELSRMTSIPQRTLSAIINRHHDQNFFEYINAHRVERATDLLLSDKPHLTILDIMEEAGFNSKSAFNRFFKKAKGMTPTEYKNSVTTP